MPKADDEAKAYFRSLVPDDPRVEVKPMFGNLAAFVNKNMFLALSGEQVAVRLPEADRSKLLQEPGSSVFEPMPGRPMGEYVALPAEARLQTLDDGLGLVGTAVRDQPARAFRDPQAHEEDHDAQGGAGEKGHAPADIAAEHGRIEQDNGARRTQRSRASS